MRITNFARVAIAATALVASSTTVSAQSWQALGPVNGSGGSFWNNVSDDTNLSTPTPCNIGAALTGVATNAGCTNEAPANLLPLGLNPTQYLSGTSVGSATGFYFGAGYWNVTLLGTITGASPVRPWNIRDNATDAILGTITTAGNTLVIGSASGFYFDISAWAPNGGVYDSRSLTGGRSQFAALGINGAGPTNVGANLAEIGNTADGRTYFVGMEDNACVTAVNCPNANSFQQMKSDFDYNDIMLQVTAVPEPSSIALMGFGLAGLAAAARRRRSA